MLYQSTRFFIYQSTRLLVKCPGQMLTNLYLVTIIGFITREGIHLEKGYGDVRPLRPPFHALSSSVRPPPISACFSSLSTLFNKTHKFYKIKFVVLEPKFTQNFHSKASNLAKIQFFKPLFLVPTRS